ncbi:hypothetical protein [Paramagnetospirillum magneticum]|uniref:Uncharacterized protein n=1 Tax=Paramagnetospirillum magneticum (strain ATCC 700264 / AMB-1) TaxID=342108 RepID=Q2W4L0_PARM1|nr:hypothetical protein [Paramagnetospirillum magneticum]BAE51215.1 hypothetical protein amb2411 [Paramagnetospirillum magneticum AMB-1]
MGILPPNLRPDIEALRVDMAVANLRDAVKDGWSVLALSTGMVDAFTDQTGIASLGGATWASGALSNRSAATVGNTRATDGSPGASWTYTDRAYSIPNGVTVSSVGIWSNATSGNGTLYIMERVGAGSYVVRASQAITFTATGWLDVALSYVVPGSGTFYVGAWVNNASVGVTPSGAFATYNGQASGSFSASETTGSMHTTRVTYSGSPGAVTVVSGAFALGFQPSVARIVSPVELGGGAIGTDCLLDLSRDGAAWAAVPLSDLGKFDASTRIVGGLVSLAGQPAGSSIYWRWRATAAYAGKNHGIWLQCK